MRHTSPLAPGDEWTVGVLETEFAGRLGRVPGEVGRPAVGVLARMQGGCVARWQLSWLGFASATISRWIRREGWARMHKGVWRLPGISDDPRSRVWAAVLAVAERDGPSLADARLTPDADPLTVLSHVASARTVVTGLTAAWARGLTSHPPRDPHLLLDTGQSVARDGVRVLRTEMDRFSAAVRIGGLWVAGPPRMLWDVAWLQRGRHRLAEHLADLLIRADRSRVMPVDDLIALVDEPSQFQLPLRVPSALRAAAELVRPGFSHSATEALGRRIAGEVAAAMDLAVHPRPFPIRHDGRIVAEADVAVLPLRCLGTTGRIEAVAK